MSNISKEFNRACIAAGVQCTLTADPHDLKKLFQFKNLSLHPVLVADKAEYILRPGEQFDYKSINGEEPKITQWFVWYHQVVPNVDVKI